MQTIPIDQILLLNRERKDFSHVPDLAESISRFGIIQPVVLTKNADGSHVLIAGESRIRAFKLLGRTEIPFTLREELTESQIKELELEENLKRKEFHWTEYVLGLARLHEIKGRTAVLSGTDWTQRMVGELFGVTQAHVSNVLRIADMLNKDIEKKGIWLCSNQSDALKYVVKKQCDDLVAEQTRRMALNTTTHTLPLPSIQPTSPTGSENLSPSLSNGEESVATDLKDSARERYLSNPHNDPLEFESYWTEKQTIDTKRITIPLSGMLKNISCLDFMQTNGESWCDHIITDPPYAIDMDMLTQSSGGLTNIDDVADEHDKEENVDLLSAFLPLAYTSLKDGGFLVLWADYMMWQTLYDTATKCGFKVQRWPIIWHKTSTCKNGSAFVNFTKNTEIAIVCRKGSATLAQTTPTSVITCPHDDMRKAHGHAFTKPFLAWEFLIEHISHPNQLIYEPFAGRGSGVLSLLRLGRRVIANEKQTNHYNYLTQNVKQHYIESLGPETAFC